MDYRLDCFVGGIYLSNSNRIIIDFWTFFFVKLVPLRVFDCSCALNSLSLLWALLLVVFLFFKKKRRSNGLTQFRILDIGLLLIFFNIWAKIQIIIQSYHSWSAFPNSPNFLEHRTSLELDRLQISASKNGINFDSLNSLTGQVKCFSVKKFWKSVHNDRLIEQGPNSFNGSEQERTIYAFQIGEHGEKLSGC